MCRGDPVGDVVYLLHQTRIPHCYNTYIGWTYQPPWYRVTQHNGLAPGGVARLARWRPLAVAMYVHGFIDARHARQFETAWQLGLRSAHLRHVARFVPSRGAIGRAEVLYALLRSRAWRDHELCLYVVPPEVGAGSGALSRFSRLRAALHGYTHVWYGPHCDP